MKQSKIERQRFYRDLWHDLLRWALLFFFVGSVLTTALINYLRFPFMGLPYICVFFVSLFISWIFLFLRRPVRNDFRGDR